MQASPPSHPAPAALSAVPRSTASRGRLLLVPNTLDFGCLDEATPPPPLTDALPAGTVRAAAGLRHWVAENAKTTRAFLKRVAAVHPLAAPLQELDIQVLPRARKGAGSQPDDEDALRALLAPALAGHDVGLMSEAGLPAVADPGAALVLAAHRLGVPVVTLSGPSAIVLALAASGLQGQSFAFVGYLPVEATARLQRIRELEQLSRKAGQTQLVIETPYRNPALWDGLLAGLQPTTWLTISCGLTLETGWSRTNTVAGWRDQPLTPPTDTPAVFGWLAR